MRRKGLAILKRKRRKKERERERESNKRNLEVNDTERRVRVFTRIKGSYRVI